MTHCLKTWPVHFDAVSQGLKKFEIRKADRPYAVGDQLQLLEYDPKTCIFSGREVTVEVTWMLPEKGDFSVPGHVVMSIEKEET